MGVPVLLWASLAPLWGPLGPCGLGHCELPWVLVGPHGPLCASRGPCDPSWSFVGFPLPLWARPLWAPWALVGAPASLWPPLGPCGPLWALMGRSLLVNIYIYM